MTLIDGYNLLHALGMAPKPGGMSLERSRLRMLEWLAGELGDASADVGVIFDSRMMTGDTEQTHRGIWMRFSRGQTADDLIEELIRQEPVPARLTVVSNDHRIQIAAKRRGCLFWDCEQFVDSLPSLKKKPPEVPQVEIGEKPLAPSVVEMDEWLRRFGAK